MEVKPQINSSKLKEGRMEVPWSKEIERIWGMI
jgi:hypothetical protein